MLKLVKHGFGKNIILQPFKIFYLHNNEQIKLIHKYSVCKMCFNYKVSISSNNSGNYLICNKDSFRWISAKSSEKPAIELDTTDTSVAVIGKQFTEYESAYHHKFLENSSEYSSTLYKGDCKFQERFTITEAEYKDFIDLKDWKSQSAYHVATAFVSLGVYSASNLNLAIDDEQFNELTLAFEDKCSLFTNDQLIDCLIALQIWPQSTHVKATNFLKIWKTLDSICLERSLDWTVDKILYIMDLWYCIKLVRLSNFVFKALNKMSRKCHDLTRVQMVQIMFYMSCVRKLNTNISMREYEYHLQKHIIHSTIEEIGIIALAFFKTQTSILNDKLLLYIMQRVAQEINTVNEVSLTAIAKSIRLSHKAQMAFTANDLVNKLSEHRMESLKLVSSIHIALISTKLQFFNDLTITKLAEKFCANPAEARLKEIERMALILSLFNYIPPSTPDILDIILQQLDLPHHVEAGESHPLALVSLVYFLTLLRTFPEKMIKHMLSEEFINKHFENKYTIAVQLLRIDYNRVMEGPPGSEHLLSPALREYVARRNSLFVPELQYKKKLNNFDQMMVDVINLTKEVLGGEEYSVVKYTLPYFPRADILFRLDAENRPIPIPEKLRSQRHFEDVVRPEGDGWRCVMVANRNLYMFNKPQLVGEAQAKLRHLRLLGYTPIVIPDHYFIPEKNKAEYLKLKYFSTPRL